MGPLALGERLLGAPVAAQTPPRRPPSRGALTPDSPPGRSLNDWGGRRKGKPQGKAQASGEGEEGGTKGKGQDEAGKGKPEGKAQASGKGEKGDATSKGQHAQDKRRDLTKEGKLQRPEKDNVKTF